MVTEEQFVQSLETAMKTALRNGMSLKLIRERIPAHLSKKMGFTVADFHATLERIEGKQGFQGLVDRVVNSFTPAERAKIGATL